MGSQHPSTNVKPFATSNCKLTMNDHITSCQKCLFSRLKTSCNVIVSGAFLGILWLKKIRMDAADDSYVVSHKYR